MRLPGAMRLRRSEKGQGETFPGQRIRKEVRALTLFEVQECVACRRRACSKKSGKARVSKSNISLHTHHLLNFEGSLSLHFSPGHYLLSLNVSAS